MQIDMSAEQTDVGILYADACSQFLTQHFRCQCNYTLLHGLRVQQYETDDEQQDDGNNDAPQRFQDDRYFLTHWVQR